MAKPRTAKQKAALRKAQQASARKRRKPGSRPKTQASARRRKALKAGAAVAVGGAMAYGATRAYKKDYGNVRSKTKAKSEQAKKAARKKVANNPRVREAVVKDLLASRRAQKRLPTKGLKTAPRYRQGRPDVRRKRKARAGR